MNKMERQVVKDIKRIKNGQPASKEEKSFLAKTFGRLVPEVSEWFWHNPITNSKLAPKVPKKTFSQRYSLKRKGITYVKGCGTRCELKFGIHDMLCPTCKHFIYHSVCLRKEMRKMGEIKKLEDETWSCPNCILKNSRIIKK